MTAEKIAEKTYGIEPTESEKERVYLALNERGGTERFVNRGKITNQKAAYFDPVGVSYSFSLNNFADGRFMITKRRQK